MWTGQQSMGTPNHEDYFMLALCLWREARGEGRSGMIAVGCVVRNRVAKNNSTFYAEIVHRLAFTSITYKSDPQLAVYPADSDSSWQLAKLLAQDLCDGDIADVTGGATLYWNPNGIQSGASFNLNDGTEVAFPQEWNRAKVQETVQIGAHIFLKELP